MADEAKVMKIGVVIAGAVILIRIVLELLHAPESVNNVFGVAWLHLIFPVFFALSIRAKGSAGPYKSLIKDVVFFAVYTRVMVLLTYMLAYTFQWQAPRFLVSRGGNVGDNIDALRGLLIIPVRNGLIWIIQASILGMIIGSVTLLLTRKKPAAKASA